MRISDWSSDVCSSALAESSWAAGCPRPRRRPRPQTAASHDHRGAVTEKSLVCGDPDASALHLAALCLATQLPGELADLCQRLSRDGLAEEGQATGRVDRDPATDGGVDGTQQRLCLAALGQADRKSTRLNSSH